jgi:hypothetical protein
MIDEAALASLMTASLDLNNSVYGVIRSEGQGEYAHLLDSSPAICSESHDPHLDAGNRQANGGGGGVNGKYMLALLRGRGPNPSCRGR